MVIWPWPWIFKVKFGKCCISGMEEPIDMEIKGCESIGYYTNFVTFNVPLTHDLDLVQILKKSYLRMGWPIDMELKFSESIKCWTHVVIFNVHITHDIDLGFSRSNFEKCWKIHITWLITWQVWTHFSNLDMQYWFAHQPQCIPNWHKTVKISQSVGPLMSCPFSDLGLRGVVVLWLPCFTRIRCFRTVTSVWIHRWLWNDAQSFN